MRWLCLDLKVLNVTCSIPEITFCSIHFSIRHMFSSHFTLSLTLSSTSDDKCLDWYVFLLSSLCKECFLAVTSHSLCPVLSSSLSHLSYHKYFFWKTICISVHNNQTSSESCTEKSVINVLAGPHCHYCLPRSQSINSRSLQHKKIFDNISHPLWSLLCHLRSTSLTFQHPLLPVSLKDKKKLKTTDHCKGLMILNHLSMKPTKLSCWGWVICL